MIYIRRKALKQLAAVLAVFAFAPTSCWAQDKVDDQVRDYVRILNRGDVNALIGSDHPTPEQLEQAEKVMSFYGRGEWRPTWTIRDGISPQDFTVYIHGPMKDGRIVSDTLYMSSR